MMTYRVIDIRCHNAANSSEERAHAQPHIPDDRRELFGGVNINGTVRRSYSQFGNQRAQDRQPRIT